MRTGNIITLLISLLSFILFSCGDKDKEEITQLVTQWQGKEIIIPSNSIFYNTG